MSNVVEFPKNGHVSRLNRYLPFSAAHDQIYEEYQSDDGLSIETAALQYILKALDAGAQCIVLTGDAGHGKTYLCRRVLTDFLDYDAVASRQLLKVSCDGRSPISEKSAGTKRAIRIHKDLSEISPDLAAKFIEAHGQSSNETLIICANEGRLRAIVSSSNQTDGICEKISKLFQSSFETGLSSQDGDIHIVNLNYQSVAAAQNGTPSFLRRVLHGWVGDGRKWGGSSCNTCLANAKCPIRLNRKMLAEDALADQRIHKLEELLATVERLGYVVTIRELLMLVAYMVTGGMNCEKVQANIHNDGWQPDFAFYNLLFAPSQQISSEQLLKGIPILAALAKLDPGSIADRKIDERLLGRAEEFETGQLDLQFKVTISGKHKLIDVAEGVDDLIGAPQNRAELHKESTRLARPVAALRRRLFFDDVTGQDTMLRRLGFRHGDEFLGIIHQGLPPAKQVQLKNLIIAGFHAIQGLRMSRSETLLHLVDPAFGRASSDAAIIARRIPISSVQILPGKQSWNAANSDWSIASSVDWSDRTVVVRINEKGDKCSDIALDLLAFECVARSAAGYVSEGFYSHQMRRIRTFLGALAESFGDNDGQIALFINGRVQSVSIDLNVIQVGGQE